MIASDTLHALVIALPLFIIALALWRAVSSAQTLTVEINHRLTELIAAAVKIARLEGAEGERLRRRDADDR